MADFRNSIKPLLNNLLKMEFHHPQGKRFYISYTMGVPSDWILNTTKIKSTIHRASDQGNLVELTPKDSFLFEDIGELHQVVVELIERNIQLDEKRLKMEEELNKMKDELFEKVEEEKVEEVKENIPEKVAPKPPANDVTEKVFTPKPQKKKKIIDPNDFSSIPEMGDDDEDDFM